MEPSAVASTSLPATRVQKSQAVIPHRTFEGHTSFVEGIVHLRGGQRIMTCSWDGSLRVWDMERGKHIREDWQEEGAAINIIALSPDGKTAVSGSNDGAVRLWDIATAMVIAKWTGHTASVTSLCWSRDGQRVVSGAHDRTVRVWDAENGKTILGPLKFGNVNTVVYSPDETMIALVNAIGFITIFDANTGKLVKNLEFTGEVNCLAWPWDDGKTLISGSWDGKIGIWNTTTWQQVAVLTEHTSIVYDIAVSPNGRILASASCDQTARLWNLETGKPINSPLQHANHVHCLSFSADGKVLATGCYENAYTWDVDAIVREAGFQELLSNPRNGDKSLFDADATPRPIQSLRNVQRLPPGFCDNALDYPASSGRHRLPLSSARQHQAGRGLTPRGRTLFSSLFRRIGNNSHEAPASVHLDQPRHLFFGAALRWNDEGIAWQEHRPTIVDVPHAQGQRRNASAREVRLRREKEKNAKKAPAGSSQLPQTSVTQQSNAASETQPSSQSNATVSSSSTTPAFIATSAAAIPTTSPPDVTIRHAGRWTHFCLFISCISAEYTDGH